MTTIARTFVAIMSLLANIAVAVDLDFRYAISARKPMFLCEVENTQTNLLLPVAPFSTDENFIRLNLENRSFGYVDEYRRRVSPPPDSYYQWIPPKERTSFWWTPEEEVGTVMPSGFCSLSWVVSHKWPFVYHYESLPINLFNVLDHGTSSLDTNRVFGLSLLCTNGIVCADCLAVVVGDDSVGFSDSTSTTIQIKSPAFSVPLKILVPFIDMKKEISVDMRIVHVISLNSILEAIPETEKLALIESGKVDIFLDGDKNKKVPLWIGTTPDMEPGQN